MTNAANPTAGSRRAAPRHAGAGTVAVLAALAASVALTALVLFPLGAAALHTDDWYWLALARHVDAPWQSYVRPLAFGYFYRPTAFVWWFVAERLAGTSAAAHYVLAATLHAASAAALFAWLRAAGLAPPRSTLAAALFAVCPPLAGTTMWLSSTNEALAILAGIVAMALAAPRVRPLPVAIALFLAATSKETGLLFAAGVALQIAARDGIRTLLRPSTALAIAVPVAAALVARRLLVLPIGPEADLALAMPVVAQGVAAWWRQAPQALAGWDAEGGGWRAVLVAAAALLAVSGALSALRGRRAVAGPALLWLLAPAALQSPITAGILSNDAARDHLVNLRFYATASVGLVVLIALAGDLGRLRTRAAALALAAIVGVGWTWVSIAQAERWRDDTRRMAVPLAAIDPLIASLPSSPPATCAVDLAGTGVPASLAPFVEPYVKARLARGSAAIDCVVLVDRIAPHFAILHADACDANRWTAAGWDVRTVGGRKLADPFGPLCQLVVQPGPDARIAATLRRSGS